MLPSRTLSDTKGSQALDSGTVSVNAGIWAPGPTKRYGRMESDVACTLFAPIGLAGCTHHPSAQQSHGHSQFCSHALLSP